ncbi:MAG: transposase, partial [Desulfovibrio sp.]|nr:transposase [Desulfovibrio sp.]
RFLPPYSPALNPIEKMWSKLKQLLRGMKPRTPDELFSSVGKALEWYRRAMPKAGLTPVDI